MIKRLQEQKANCQQDFVEKAVAEDKRRQEQKAIAAFVIKRIKEKKAKRQQDFEEKAAAVDKRLQELKDKEVAESKRRQELRLLSQRYLLHRAPILR